MNPRKTPFELLAGSYRLPSRTLSLAAMLGLTTWAAADTVAYWNFNSLSIGTPSLPGTGDVPSTIAPDLGSGTLSLSGYGGNVASFSGTNENALNTDAPEESLSLQAGPETSPEVFAANGTFVEFTVDFTGFEDPLITFATRGTGSGFTSGVWSYSLDGSSFTPLAGNTSSNSSGWAVRTVDLFNEDTVDNAPNVVFRYTLSGAMGATGNNRIDNLQITATALGADVTPPMIASLNPADDATDVPLDSVDTLTIGFSEDVVPGSGDILVKKLSDDTIVNTIDVTDFGQVELLGSQLTLLLPTPLEASTAYYVEIPAGAVADSAGNQFAGISGNAAWNFQVADPAAPPTVVINKYLNAGVDMIELLVIGDETSGTTLDMQGMVIKDFSSNTTGDSGGSYTFAADPLWSAVPVGTLVTLSETTDSPDIMPGDFTLSIGLNDPAYFTSNGGSFDISTTDMVMIKAAGSTLTGTEGGIHAMSAASGSLGAGSLFTAFTGAKLFGSGSTGTNSGVQAENSTSTLADFNGTDATGGLSLTASDFGAPNNGTNAAYISSLRGLTPGDGDGLVIVTNATTGSPFENLGFFDNAASGQDLKITLQAQISGATITSANFTMPAEFGVPTVVSLSGAGSTGASFTISGQTIEVSSASVTTSDPLEVTISGLTSPDPVALSDNGNYTITTSTAASGGTLTELASQPAARVIIPIASLRDVDENGNALDLNSVVAVEGVVTEEDFGSGVSNFSSFVQDSAAGINIFSSTENPGFVRGNRYAILGTVAQFNGLTEIIPASTSDIIDLGADTEVTAETITLATLFADPESYEGKLITVENLSYVSGSWGPSSTVVLQDSSPTEIDIRIQSGTTATTEPTYPVTITGILGQFDGSNPKDSGYQIMPRDPADLAAGTLSDFDSWAATTGAVLGMSGDDDMDGLDNAFEYAFGLNPTSGGSVNPITVPVDPAGGTFTYTRRTQSLTGLTYKVFTSTTLADGDWVEDTGATLDVSTPVDNVETVEVTLSAPAPLTAPKLFVRVVSE